MIVTMDSEIKKHQTRIYHYPEIVVDEWWEIDGVRVTEEEALEGRKMQEAYRVPYDTKTKRQLPIPVTK